MKKGLFLVGWFLLVLFAGQSVNASDFPSRPVDIVISFAPGGSLDLAVRVMGDDLTKSLGAPAILANKGGAGGAAGTGVCAER